MFIKTPYRFSFDELHYVPSGYSLYVYGYVLQWFNLEDIGYSAKEGWEQFGSLTPHGDILSNSHPPLGQYLIGFFVQFDPLNPLMWRLSSAIFGFLTVVLVMLIVWQILRKHAWVLTAGLFTALSNLNVAMSNIGILDIFLTFFTLLGTYFSIVYIQKLRQNVSAEKYLIFTVFAFSLAVSVKWSALYYIAVFAVTILIHQIVMLMKNNGFALSAMVKLLSRNVAYFIVIPVMYFLIWLPSIINYYVNVKGETFFNSVKFWFDFQINQYYALSELSSGHAYSSNALEWLWVARPIRFTVASGGGDGLISVLSAMPNLLLWFSGLVAVIWLSVYLIVRRNFNDGKVFIVLGFFAGWAPWLLYHDRTIFQFYTIIFEPYMIVALIIMMAVLKAKIVNMTLSLLIVTTSVVFYPISSGMPISPQNFAYNFEKLWEEIIISNGMYNVEQLTETAYEDFYSKGYITVPYGETQIDGGTVSDSETQTNNELQTNN